MFLLGLALLLLDTKALLRSFILDLQPLKLICVWHERAKRWAGVGDNKLSWFKWVSSTTLCLSDIPCEIPYEISQLTATKAELDTHLQNQCYGCSPHRERLLYSWYVVYAVWLQKMIEMVQDIERGLVWILTIHLRIKQVGSTPLIKSPLMPLSMSWTISIIFCNQTAYTTYHE